ncbi:MAG TPA: UDP-N-acetylmuramate--L-alanine ligase [Candidatus Aminicenantes bacterium]|nr:UDP-N-acetylmuramate--L-alanine ligase [Candidatus Aminicenantes bacterium]
MIKYSRIKRVHFTGIGGAGMSGIAEVLHNMGFLVSGSDIAEGSAVKRFQRMGIPVAIGHNALNLDDAETLVYSSAIRKDNVELVEARRRRIPVIPRAEMLGELMRLKFSIAVAGTHGKTTTTSMIATILHFAGLDPTYVVGGRLKTEESGAKLGRSDYLIAEADESDGSFLQLFPTVAVINNIEDDHLDHYGDMDHLLTAFTTFGDRVPFYGSIVLNSDCPNCRRIYPQLNKRVRSFGLGESASVRGRVMEESLFRTSFELLLDGESHGEAVINVGGRHNIMNALAASASCLEVGLDTPQILDGLEKFYLPERRFQVLFRSHDFLVVDDYAHHPTEIRATLDTLKKGDYRRIIAVFQPHRYTRLQLLQEGFAAAFAGISQVLVAPPYAAGQKAIPGVSGMTLAQRVDQLSGTSSRFLEDFNAITAYLEKEICCGDAVVFLSAGDLSHLAHDFAARMERFSR